MIEINLIPDVKRELLRAQRARGVVISMAITVSIIAVGLVGVLLVYMYGVQWARGEYLASQIKEKNSKLLQVEDLSKILTIQSQLKSISALNDSKNMSSRMFDMISALTPQDNNNASVSFSQITLSPGSTGDTTSGTDTAVSTTSTGGQVHLEGQTSGYDAMEAFKKRIANTVFEYKASDEDGTKTAMLASNISTTDISYGEDSDGQKVLRFTLNFEYPPELLQPKSSAIKYKLNVDGNVTDSYIGIPRFTERAKDLQGAN